MMTPVVRLLAVAIGAILLAACAETQLVVHTAKRVQKSVKPEPPKPAGIYKIGDPYEIDGVWYYPAEDYEYDESGIASWYGRKFHGRLTANGEIYDMNAMTAAHRTLPLPSFVRVTNLENGRSVIVRVNDRGPFARGRILDASRRTAQLLGFERAGTARVRVRILANESRIIAARMKGDKEIDRIGTPITVARLPKPPVKSEVLPPLPGAGVAPPPKGFEPKKKEATEVSAPKPGKGRVNNVSAGPVSGQVLVGAARSTNMYVQPGAYKVFENANRVAAILTGVGPVVIMQVLIGGRDLYRVRVGPLETVEEADRILDDVIGAGYPDARIIVE